MRHVLSTLLYNFLSRKSFFLLLYIGSILLGQAQEASSQEDAALISTGASLFKGNCTVCHAINEQVVGPALRDVHKRRSVEWIRTFVKNSQKVIESGDEYAVALYNKYNQTQMTAFDFSTQELDAIIAYIVSESEKPIEQVADASATTSGSSLAQGETIISLQEYYLIWSAIIVVLLLLLVALGVLVQILQRYALDQTSVDEEEKKHLRAKPINIFKNDAIMGFIVFFFVAISIKAGLDALYSIGIQQHYAPTQPIAFSHKIHAGTYEIDCNYCHTGVRIGKSANIPSANICMNCHGEIKKESPEIQKIYAAIEQNQPIEWIRVHNLPDLAYFNHQQHVEIGKVACETCHGDIKTMDVVTQHAPLTMGWCINCHRSTNIQADHVYYDKLQALHKDQDLKVEDIGGIECSKCHY